MNGLSRFARGASKATGLLAISTCLAAFPAAAQDPGPEYGDIRPAHRDSGEDWDETPTGRVARFARHNYVWPYASGPSYGSTTAHSPRERGVLHTPVGSFRLSDGSPRLPSEL